MGELSPVIEGHAKYREGKKVTISAFRNHHHDHHCIALALAIVLIIIIVIAFLNSIASIIIAIAKFVERIPFIITFNDNMKTWTAI